MKTNTRIHRHAMTTLASLILSTFAMPALAQQDPTKTKEEEERARRERIEKLEKIEVITTGQRGAKAVDKIPGAVTIVTPEEIQHTRALTEDATAVLA